MFANAFARGGGGVYKGQLAGDVQLWGSAQCSLFCFILVNFIISTGLSKCLEWPEHLKAAQMTRQSRG